MLRLLCMLSLTLALVACANPQLDEYNQWVRNAGEQAEAGHIRWSQYYRGCFSRLMEVHRGYDGKLLELEFYNTLIAYSLEYESGQLSQSDFDQKRRSAQLAHVMREEGVRRSTFRAGAQAGSAGDIYPH